MGKIRIVFIVIALLVINQLTAVANRIGILTCDGFEEYKSNELKLIELFQNHSVPAEHVVWNRLDQDWSNYRAIIVLSIWDYCQNGNLEKFLKVLQDIKNSGTPVYNSCETIVWNCQKTYLKDFEQWGIKIPETVWLEPQQLSSIPKILEEKKWQECVLKPVVSSGGNNTYRLKAEDPEIKNVLEKCRLLDCEWMLQPFLTEILDEGEWSFIFIDSQFSHALLKKPACGNFLAQPFRGAIAIKMEPEKWMIAEAARILKACPQNPLHARVDLIRQNKSFLVMEVELIEPYLYDDLKEGLSENLFKAVLGRIGEKL